MSQHPLVKYAEAEVPRYTSYPTAVQFSDAVGERHYRAWLQELPPGHSLSLYIHIPFCRSLCWYCGCHTTIVHSHERVAAYVKTLFEELALLARALPDPGPLSHVHFGGGTPTILKDREFSQFMERLRTLFGFARGAEIAVEIDPRTITRQKAQSLGQAGVTRASLGVQDLNPHVQEKINRIQPFDVVAQAVDDLRAAGVSGINLDLMYGLPGQWSKDIRHTIAQCLSLEPDRFAVFGYAHVPWFKKHQQVFAKADLPGTVARMAQMRTASEALISAGYQPIGFDHFAKPGDALAQAARAGTLRRNFQGYTTDRSDVLLGLGASAIGTLPQGHVQNAPRLDAYRRAIESGRLPVTRGLVLKGEDRLRREAIERLMCDFYLDTGALCRRSGYGESHLDAALERLAPLAADGLLTLEGRQIHVLPEGRFFIRNIAARFDAYWHPGPARHSRAI